MFEPLIKPPFGDGVVGNFLQYCQANENDVFGHCTMADITNILTYRLKIMSVF